MPPFGILLQVESLSICIVVSRVTKLLDMVLERKNFRG